MPVSLIFKRNGYSRKRWFMFNLSCNRGRMMNEMDDPFCRDRMRIEVARRLVCHQARTQTITHFTNLTRNRLATLRRRWSVSQDTRRRGPPPRSIAIFLRTPRARNEAAALATMCINFDALPIRSLTGAVEARPPLILADRLCETYEAYRACVPDSKIEFEELLLLAQEIAKGEMVKLSTCKGCNAAFLILTYEAPRRTCSHCEP
jgi:hypothetical protein